MGAALVPLAGLALGERFRYPGHPQVYVLLDRGDCGRVAHAMESIGPGLTQGIFTAAETSMDLRALMVEHVPVETR